MLTDWHFCPGLLPTQTHCTCTGKVYMVQVNVPSGVSSLPSSSSPLEIKHRGAGQAQHNHSRSGPIMPLPPPLLKLQPCLVQDEVGLSLLPVCCSRSWRCWAKREVSLKP